MSIDLGAILAANAPTVTSVLNTSGTTGSLSRPSAADDIAVDPTTLALSDPTPATTYATGVPAIVSPTTLAAEEVGPGRPSRVEGYRVLLPASLTDVRTGDVFTATASRDAALVGVPIVLAADAELHTAGLLRVAYGVARRP